MLPSSARSIHTQAYRYVDRALTTGASHSFIHIWGSQILDLLAADTHYKYFFLFLIPTTAYFVIANWVGWQYYRNS